MLYTQAPLALLGCLANVIREKNGNKTFFNKNIHIETTTDVSLIVSLLIFKKITKERSLGINTLKKW